MPMNNSMLRRPSFLHTTIIKRFNVRGLSFVKTQSQPPGSARSFLAFLLPLYFCFASLNSLANTEETSDNNSAFKVCAVYPHLKDSYWLSVNYGMVEQAKKLNITLKVYESGGYPNHKKQQSQLADCAHWGAEAIVLGTVSPDLYTETLRDYTGTTPVFATVNHLELDDYNARYFKGSVGVDWHQMGYLTGQYLAQKHPKGSGRVNIALFPGPDSSGGTKPAVKGFYEAIQSSDIHIVETLWADNDKELQRNLVQELMLKHEVDYIVGSAVATEAAISEVRSSTGQEHTQLISFYLSHGVYRGIIRGRVEFSPTDQMVEQGRLSILQAYHYLNGNRFTFSQAPEIQIITASSLLENRINHSLSPSGYRPTFSVETVD